MNQGKSKLGNRQAEVLKMLRKHGRWAWDCGWVFRNSRTETQQVLDSMIGRNLLYVQETAVIMKNGRHRLNYFPYQQNAAMGDR